MGMQANPRQLRQRVGPQPDARRQRPTACRAAASPCVVGIVPPWIPCATPYLPTALAVSLHASNDALRDEAGADQPNTRCAALMAACRHRLPPSAPRVTSPSGTSCRRGGTACPPASSSRTRDIAVQGFNLIPFSLPELGFLTGRRRRASKRFAGSDRRRHRHHDAQDVDYGLRAGAGRQVAGSLSRIVPIVDRPRRPSAHRAAGGARPGACVRPAAWWIPLARMEQPVSGMPVGRDRARGRPRCRARSGLFFRSAATVWRWMKPSRHPPRLALRPAYPPVDGAGAYVPRRKPDRGRQLCPALSLARAIRIQNSPGWFLCSTGRRPPASDAPVRPQPVLPDTHGPRANVGLYPAAAEPATQLPGVQPFLRAVRLDSGNHGRSSHLADGRLPAWLRAAKRYVAAISQTVEPTAGASGCDPHRAHGSVTARPRARPRAATPPAVVSRIPGFLARGGTSDRFPSRAVTSADLLPGTPRWVTPAAPAKPRALHLRSRQRSS